MKNPRATPAIKAAIAIKTTQIVLISSFPPSCCLSYSILNQIEYYNSDYLSRISFLIGVTHPELVDPNSITKKLGLNVLSG